jgi:hypothetical protein
MLILEKMNQRGMIVLIRSMGCFRKVDRRWRSCLGGLMGRREVGTVPRIVDDEDKDDINKVSGIEKQEYQEYRGY